MLVQIYRILLKQIFKGPFKIQIGAIGEVIDQSTKSGPEIEVIYEVIKSATMIYDMHPVVSFKNNQSDFVYHKKVSLNAHVI